MKMTASVYAYMGQGKIGSYAEITEEMGVGTKRLVVKFNGCSPIEIYPTVDGNIHVWFTPLDGRVVNRIIGLTNPIEKGD